jgi:hypothetical protein
VSPAPELEAKLAATAEIGVAAPAGLAVNALMTGAATRPRPAAIDTVNALSLPERNRRRVVDVAVEAGMRFTGSPDQRGGVPGSDGGNERGSVLGRP